jgi:hypothetical protein
MDENVRQNKGKQMQAKALHRSASVSEATQKSGSDNTHQIETVPSAARLAVAIAGYPYSIRTAVLDITDNAVENGATRIAVLLNDTGDFKDAVVVADNGTGVLPEILDEVLRPGSYTADRYSENSLSRYGIGLKGAGLAIGQRITVLTKCSGGTLQRRAIDAETIKKADKWIQETRNPNEKERNYFEWAMSQLGTENGITTGTVILIERLNIRSRDRTRILREIIRACGETYARFLSQNIPEENRVRIKVDSTEISAVDPLHRENQKRTVLYDRQEIKLEDGSVLFFSAVALPHPKQLEPELTKQYRYTQENQGIYVYRNNRLIAGGQTFDFFDKDGHLNALRAELVYGTDADHHVLVDVAKSTIMLSQELTNRLQECVSNCTKTANVLWREFDVITPEDIKGLFDESNRLIASRAKLLAKKRVTPKNGKVTAKKPMATPAKPTVNGDTKEEAPYLVPVDSLPDGVLYRPIWNGQTETVVVEVNLSHAFSKAVFSVSPEEAKKKIPRKATTAVQQLIYILGSTEYAFDDKETEVLFEQFRKHASLNLTGLLTGL